MILRKSLRLHLSQVRFFWWLRAGMKRLAFWMNAKVFGVRNSLVEEKTKFQSLRHLFSITWKPLIFALAFAGLLQYIDPYLHSYYQKFSISVPDDGDYVTFLATVSGIGGVFIGLYYAGISAVASAIYAKVPNNVRDLLAHERFGNVYMLLLSFLTLLGLILVALRISGFPRVYLAVPIVTILAGLGVIAFVKLGQRAFYLFDPTQLSNRIFEQLQRWLEMAKIGGFQWLDKSFQNHAHRQASATLDTLDTLADITAKERQLSGRPFIELSQRLLKFMVHYEQSKGSIPTDSSWFEQRYQHRDWYRTEYSRVSIAHETGTSLQPDVATNKEWVEGKVLPILKRCIATNLAEEKYTELLGLFNHIDMYIKILAQVGEVQRAFELLKALLLNALKQIAGQTHDELVKDEVLEKVAVVELLASFSVSIALSYHEQLESFDRNYIENSLASIRWDNDTDIYRQGFPAYCLSQLEWLKTRLDFEKEVEGKYITPLWYRTELVRQVVAERFVDNTKVLLSMGSALYADAISIALSRKHPWLAAAVMSREWEYWHKVESQMDVWEETWVDLSAHRKIEGLEWPKFEFDELRTIFENRQVDLVNLMSRQNLLLALLSRPEGFPDYAGQFLYTSGEVAFDALLGNKVELLRSVIEPYLHGCLLRFNDLCPRSENVDWRFQQEFKIASAALLDVMHVSGYAKLLAAYHGNDALWNEVTAAWDKCMAEKAEPSLTSLLVGVVNITKGTFEIPHHSISHTAWEQKINWQLQNVPRHEEYHMGSIGSDTVIDHDSPLVRIFAENEYGSFYDGIDIFFEFYLRNIDGFEESDFGLKRRDLGESIEREEQRRLPNDKEVDPE